MLAQPTNPATLATPIYLDDHTKTVASSMFRSLVIASLTRGDHLTRTLLRVYRKQSQVAAWSMAQSHYNVH